MKITIAHLFYDILNLYGLPCSIGIAPNKFLAKMASDMKKPLGITILRKREIAENVKRKLLLMNLVVLIFIKLI